MPHPLTLNDADSQGKTVQPVQLPVSSGIVPLEYDCPEHAILQSKEDF